MDLRSKLVQLTLAAALPPIVLCLLLGAMLVNYEREALTRGAIDRNRAFMTAVDAEIRGHLLSLSGLAASKSLETGDLAAFRNEAQRFVKSQPAWQSVHLALPSGQQVVHTNLPLNGNLPNVLDLESVRRVVSTRQAVAGNINLGRTTDAYVVPIRLPVMRGDSVAYVLSAVVDPQAFVRLIESQHLPAAWVMGLVDENGHFIARLPPRAPTEFASDAFRAAVRATREGWFSGPTGEGNDTFSAHKTSELTNWSVGLDIPIAEVNAAAYRAAGLFGIGAAITIGLAVSLAYVYGLGIAVPIAALATAARSIGAGHEPSSTAKNAGILEVRDVAQALSEASAALRERAQLVEREQSILMAADRAKDEFLAMLGHELRNPLSAVSNAAMLLNRPELPLESRNSVHAIIRRQTEQLTRLVDDLLDVGRVVAGKIRLEITAVDLCEVTRAALAAMQASGRCDSHRIAIQCEESVAVQGDRARLEQVVTNLLSNAITYTPAGGCIDIAVIKAAGSAVLRVADTGAGLRDEDRAAIFHLFYQADKSLHRRGGLGLGLTLVKRLVEMQAGTISVSSAGLGKGSTFTVKLPLSDPPAQRTSLTPNEKSVASALNILVVDDNLDARISLQMLLRIEGHIVDVAADGPAALRAITQDLPHVVLLDIGMPGMDGYEIARQIRHRYQQRISLVAMTGYGQSEDVRRAMDAGFDAHLVKPAELTTLTAVLHKIGRKPIMVIERRA